MPQTVTKNSRTLASPQALAEYQRLQEEIKWMIANTHQPLIDAAGFFLAPYAFRWIFRKLNFLGAHIWIPSKLYCQHQYHSLILQHFNGQ